MALVFGIAQVNAAARDGRERLTLETLLHYQTREFSELVLNITTREMPSSSEEFRALPPSHNCVDEIHASIDHVR